MLSKETQTFLIVAETGSFSKASQQLYLSPVAVMKQINQFETDIGVPLFSRSKRGVTLTAAGDNLYRETLKLQKEATAIIDHTRLLAAHKVTTIRVGTSLLRSCAALIDLWSQQAALKADFQIQIVPFTDDGTGLHQLFQLLGKQIDCFVSPYDTVELTTQFAIQKLGAYQCQIGVPSQNKLSQKTSLSWQDLADQDLLLLKDGASHTIDAIRQEIKSRQIAVRIHDLPSFYDLSSFNRSVSENYLIEAITPWQSIHPNLKFLPMPWNYEIPYGLVSAQNASPEVKAFIQASRQLLSSGQTG